MKRKNGIILGVFILLFIAVTSLIMFGSNDIISKKSSIKFSKLLKQENLDDLSLTIYYINPLILTLYPLSVDDLINMDNVHKIIIDGSNLEEHIDLLNRISNVDLVPVEQESRVDARLYYVFETENNRKVFDVSMWGKDNSIFVNGIETEENDIFYDVLETFLPDEITKDLELYLTRGKQE